MPVATSTNTTLPPHPSLHQRPERIIPVEVTSRPVAETEDDLNDGGWTTTKPPLPVYTTRFEGGKYIVGVEAFLNSNNGCEADENVSTTIFSSCPPPTSSSPLRMRKTSLPANLSSSGYHRSRDRTRVSAVQRLVERKLAQKEKEREKERDRSLGGGPGETASCASSCSTNFSSRQSFRAASPPTAARGRRPPRDLSGSRSENGFMLGAGRTPSPSKENVDPAAEFCFFGPRPRSARSVSATRLGRGDDEPIAKTYITIGPGKPTRIREHSPAKSAKLSPEETVTSARERSAAAAAAFVHSRSTSPLGSFDLNRRSSPSPQRKTSLNLSSNSSCSSSNSSGSNNNVFSNSIHSANKNKARDVLRTASPLKSTNILKTFRASKCESPLSSSEPPRETGSSRRIFQTETSFPVNQTQQEQKQEEHQQRLFSTGNRRLSVDIINSIHQPQANSNVSDSNNNSNSFGNKNNSSSSQNSTADSKRASPESERPSSAASSLFSTPFRKEIEWDTAC
jgi:hypothetical protein